MTQSTKTYRIGQIVPSSNITMETEIPAMLTARQLIRPERFTFHSSRMRMKNVSKEELAAMDGESDRCALELSDAAVDVMGYACLVAIMAMGPGYHRASQKRLRSRTEENGCDTPVVTSAGALVDALGVMKAKRVVVVAPYMKPLTEWWSTTSARKALRCSTTGRLRSPTTWMSLATIPPISPKSLPVLI